jgi:ABC-2 type transport system permease protein
MNRFALLLKREYWEHKGGFFWAPIWTSGLFLLFTVIGMLVVTWHGSGRANGDVHIGVPLKQLIAKIPPEEMSKLGFGLDAGLAGFWLVLQAVLFFVLFFYLIGALYDDRRDRSILFWKSLPISDTQTVLSKVVMAAFAAPLIAWAATVAMNFAFLVLLSLFVGLNGVNPMDVIWGPAEPLALWAKMLAVVPINALWALPAIGWLLLVSSFAKSKPFLWAVAVPVALGIMIAVFEVLESLRIPDSWYWQNVCGRILLSLVPGSWLWTVDDQLIRGFERQGPMEIFSAETFGAVLSAPSMWIGAVAGSAMIAASVWFRRQRELAD